MRAFSDLSIREKLTRVSMLASGSALLSASLAFLLYDLYALRSALVARLKTSARIVGANSASALLFDDDDAARRTLSALDAEAHVVSAAIYRPDGRVFASYSHGGKAPATLPPSEMGAAERYGSDRLELHEPIVFEGNRVGTVSIETDLGEVTERISQFAGIVVAVSLASFAVALVLSARYQRSLSQPLLKLAETARDVSLRQDYSARAVASGSDELAQLTRTFNEMLDGIQDRDASLREARDGLEERVEQRTHELKLQLAERRRGEEEIRRLNGELAQRLDELTLVNQELEAFSYSVSHDLRAPLRHINGFVEMLGRRLEPTLAQDDKSRHYVGVIAKAARQMGTLIDDLLGFSRMSRSEMLTSRVSLDALVQEALLDIRQDTDKRQIDWVIGRLPEVCGDRAMLKQVVVNLLANAVKYSRGRETARIEVGTQPGANGHSVVFVRDNGAGFDMRFADKLFGVFQRLHRADQFEGTGIGLATVRRIVHRHGGTVWAEGKTDVGASFFISLPTSTGATA
jgi:signal transduction histidine kinase